MSNKFGKLDLEGMKTEDSRLNSDGGSNFLDQFVPMPDVRPGQKGSVSVRLLPPIIGAPLFQFNRTHKMNGRSTHCPRELEKGKWSRSIPCPICDYYSSLWKQVDKLDKAGHVNEAEALKDEARSIKPIERYYYNAIVRTLITAEGDTLKDAGPRILSVGKILHKKIIRAIVGDEADPDSQLGNVTDVEAGYDLIIRKEVTTGNDNFPKYDDTSFARSQSPAGAPEQIAVWQEELIDLSKLRNPKPFEELEKELAIHRGLIQDDTVGFNADDFDTRMKAKYQDEIKDMMEHSSGGVSVPDGVPTTSEVASVASQSTTSTEAEPSSKEATEDLVVEDADFMAELEEMGG